MQFFAKTGEQAKAACPKIFLPRPHLHEPNPHTSRFGRQTECALHPAEGVGRRAVSACAFPISPVSAKSVGAYAKFKIYLRRCRNEMRADIYMYPRWYIIYVWCSSQLSISRFGSRFTKKPNFGTLKIEKTFFVGGNKNQSLWDSLPSQWPRTCPIWSHSDKLCHDQVQT
jgi:hypothetical protein